MITAKLSEKIKKELNGAWKKKAQVTIRNGTCTVKNPTGVWMVINLKIRWNLCNIRFRGVEGRYILF